MSLREWLTLYRCGCGYTGLAGLPLTVLVLSILTNVALLVLLSVWLTAEGRSGTARAHCAVVTLRLDAELAP